MQHVPLQVAEIALGAAEPEPLVRPRRLRLHDVPEKTSDPNPASNGELHQFRRRFDAGTMRRTG